MLTNEFVVRYVDGLWQIRLGGRLLGGKQNKMEALQVAQGLARSGADRGEYSKIAIADVDGSTIEYPTIRPA